MVEFDFSHIPDDPSKIHSGGGDRVKPGKGMVLITDFSEYTGANGKAHELEFEIVAWSDSSEHAKTHTENIFHEDRSGKGHPMKRMTALCMASGLFNAEDIRQWKANGVKPEIDTKKLVGRPMMVELIEEKDQRDPTKTYVKVGNIGLAFYHMKDPVVASWPKNQSLYNRYAALVGDWVNGLTQTKKEASAQTDPFAAVT